MAGERVEIPFLNPYKGKNADDNADWLKVIRDGYYQERDLKAHEIAEREERRRGRNKRRNKNNPR